MGQFPCPGKKIKYLSMDEVRETQDLYGKTKICVHTKINNIDDQASKIMQFYGSQKGKNRTVSRQNVRGKAPKKERMRLEKFCSSDETTARTLCRFFGRIAAFQPETCEIFENEIIIIRKKCTKND